MAVLTSRFADGLAVGPDLVGGRGVRGAAQALAGLSGPPTWSASSSAARIPTRSAGAGCGRWRWRRAREVIGCSATGVIGGDRGVELTPR